MSEDVKKDLLKAMQDAQNSNVTSNNVPQTFPNPAISKYTLNDEGSLFPSPVYRQDSKDKK